MIFVTPNTYAHKHKYTPTGISLFLARRFEQNYYRIWGIWLPGFMFPIPCAGGIRVPGGVVTRTSLLLPTLSWLSPLSFLLLTVIFMTIWYNGTDPGLSQFCYLLLVEPWKRIFISLRFNFLNGQGFAHHITFEWGCINVLKVLAIPKVRNSPQTKLQEFRQC